MLFYFVLALSLFKGLITNSIITSYPINDGNDIDYILVMRIEEMATYHNLYRPNQTRMTNQLQDLILESDLVVNITSNITLWDWFHLISIYRMPILNSTVLVYQTTPHLEAFTASIYKIIKATVDNDIGIQMISKVTKCSCHLCDLGNNCQLDTICKKINYLNHVGNNESTLGSNQNFDRYYYGNDDYCFSEAAVMSLMDIIRPRRGIFPSHHLNIKQDKLSCFCNNCPGRFICATKGSCFSTISIQYKNGSSISSFVETIGCLEESRQAEYCQANVNGEERHCCKKSFCNTNIPAKIKMACYCTSCKDAKLCWTEGSCYMQYNHLTGKRIYGCHNKEETNNWCGYQSTDFTITCCKSGALCNRLIHKNFRSILPFYKIVEVYNVKDKKKLHSKADLKIMCDCGNNHNDLSVLHGSCLCTFKHAHDARPSYCCGNSRTDQCCSQSSCRHTYSNILDKEVVIAEFGQNVSHCLEMGTYVRPDPTNVLFVLNKDNDRSYEWKMESHVYLKMINNTNGKMLATLSFVNISDEDSGRYIFEKWPLTRNKTFHRVIIIISKSKILNVGESDSISFMVPINRWSLLETEYEWIRPSFVSINDSHIFTLHNDSHHTIGMSNYRERLNGTYQLNIINNATKEVICSYIANFIMRESPTLNVTVKVGKASQLMIPNISNNDFNSKRMHLTKLYDKHIWTKSIPFKFLRKNDGTYDLVIKISDHVIEPLDAGTYILDNENGFNIRVLLLLTKNRKVTSLAKGSDLRVTFSLPNINLKHNRLHIVWYYPLIKLPTVHKNVSIRLNETHTSLVIMNVTAPYHGTYYLHINDVHDITIYYFYRNYSILIKDDGSVM